MHHRLGDARQGRGWLLGETGTNPLRAFSKCPCPNLAGFAEVSFNFRPLHRQFVLIGFDETQSCGMENLFNGLPTFRRALLMGVAHDEFLFLAVHLDAVGPVDSSLTSVFGCPRTRA
jgi:hypothetical protein